MNIIPLSMDKEVAARTARIASELSACGIDAMLLSSFANLYYTCGRVFCGYAYITSQGKITYFVKRPVGFEGDNVAYIRKPEQIAEAVASNMPKVLALELGITSYNTIERLKKTFPGAEIADASAIMGKIRSVKSEYDCQAQNVRHSPRSSIQPHQENIPRRNDRHRAANRDRAHIAQ